jgi:hypothetical protein
MNYERKLGMDAIVLVGEKWAILTCHVKLFSVM